jgi:predicted secreted Zn-dependent protease
VSRPRAFGPRSAIRNPPPKSSANSRWAGATLAFRCVRVYSYIVHPALRYSLAALLTLSAACAGRRQIDLRAAPPGVHLLVDTRYFAVDPSQGGDFFARGRQEAGLTDGRSNWAGKTTTYITYTYDLVPSAERCAIQRTRVRLEANVLLPQWRAPREAPREMVEWWSALSNTISAHEREHVRIAEEGARDLIRSLDAIAAGRCDDLAGLAKAAADRSLAEMQRRQEAFDKSG